MSNPNMPPVGSGPLIKMTPDEIKKGAPWMTSWYKTKIINVVSSESKDKQSINHVVHYEVMELQGAQDPDYLNRTLGLMGGTNFNSKAMGKMIPLLAACEGITQVEFIEKYKTTGIEFKLTDLKGKFVQIKVEMGDNNSGGFIPKVTGWLPYSDIIPF